jgi:putative aldouronate transport system substrate-binding protein
MACVTCRGERRRAGERQHSRRTVLRGALALGISGKAMSAVPASAQDATPAGASVNPDTGVPAYITEPDTEILMPITEPLTAETVTFRVLMVSSDEVTDYDDNAFTKWLEEKTNVHVQWDLVPEDDVQSKLNVMLASGDIPDIIFGAAAINPSQLLLYGSQGIFLPLNDLIAENGPRATKLLEVQPVVRDVITAPDGAIYAMPGFGECYHCTMNQKLWLYKPWLDELGLEIPTTTDELEAVLKAFKEQDPNGNGEADEVPLSGAIGDANTRLPSYLMNAFIYYPGPLVGDNESQPRLLIVLDGKITAAYATPQWREGLRYLNRLYAQGLIDPQIFTQDEDALQRLGNNPDEVILGAVLGGSAGAAVSIEREPGARWTEYVSVPPLAGPDGVRYAAWNPYLPAFPAAAITNACQNPALAVAWIDTLLWQEATLREDRGPLDQDWRWALEGEVDVLGGQALWKLLVIHDQPTNQSWQGTGPIYFSRRMFSGIAIDPAAIDLNLEKILHDTTANDYEPYKQPREMTLPPLAFTNDQAIAIADPEATIGTYVQQMLAQFVRGEADLDAGWDSYLATLEGMGLAPYLEVYQAVYDAKYGQ